MHSAPSVCDRTLLTLRVLDLFAFYRQPGAMHPPPFSVAHKLSEWPDCALELRCHCSERVVLLPVRMLLDRGDRTFGTVLAALRCSKCGGEPAPVYLVAGYHRTFNHGPSPDCAVELVPQPRQELRRDD